MSLSLTILLVMGVLYACGVYLMLERSMTRVLLGFLLVGNATNLLIFSMAGMPGVAPIADGEAPSSDMTDPLPQALVLTAIVITFGVSAFLLALIYRSWRLGQADEVEDDEADLALSAGGVPEEEAAVDADTDFVDDEHTEADEAADRTVGSPSPQEEATT
ncbi:Na(+)/H(+) antiporter subunit C [Homoserinibacter sp. YIM 151385]|uniref:Na(+)/H(+) antiporter subunit C n=1 Tax=Homoserinibacter sp. YIM 151385 TaxID=2985506 RepID=UPI0022F0F3B9|nr:Na(+)/H(+) antiporter subunit C [Homoserinibacter sp. YIM 151385]WBU39290.1 Na(+)/H(+) antiporter subunit C [Homoserinibacter sp. YIM 151385]